MCAETVTQGGRTWEEYREYTTRSIISYFIENPANVMPQGYVISISTINGLGLSVNLKKPLEFFYRIENGLHVITSKDLNLICYEDTYEKSFRCVQEELALLWKEIALADDSELAPDALKLKQYLLSFA